MTLRLLLLPIAFAALTPAVPAQPKPAFTVTEDEDRIRIVGESL